MLLLSSTPVILSLLSLILFPEFTSAQPAFVRELARLDSRVLSQPQNDMLALDLSKRIFQANQRSSQEWHEITELREWKDFVEVRLRALRKSLGDLPELSGPPEFRVAETLSGDGFTVQNLLFKSRPRFWVTANL